jgi:hypothetical protein
VLKIYGFFNSNNEFGDAMGIAIDETGTVLATHISSSESFSVHDLGMDRGCTWKHNVYNEAHPGGWECEFVRIRDNRDAHTGLQAALAAFDERAKNADKN